MADFTPCGKLPLLQAFSFLSFHDDQYHDGQHSHTLVFDEIAFDKAVDLNFPYIRDFTFVHILHGAFANLVTDVHSTALPLRSIISFCE